MRESSPGFEIDIKIRESVHREMNAAVEAALKGRYPQSPLLTGTQWQRVLAYTAEWGGFLQDTIMKFWFLSWETLLVELTHAWEAPILPLMPATVDMERPRSIGEKFCRKHWVVAVKEAWLALPGAAPAKPEHLPVAVLMPNNRLLRESLLMRRDKTAIT